ncbi:unnamed protein product [Diabrotica balteata]|uniref:Calreticulin n=1 Tax=Diabrotica balteata TaxID=107213 RepID=A0A9N9T1K8_DIABA|nr:unnamed protein product [Diabrotica balteata]
MDNPECTLDSNLYKQNEIGFDLWQVKSGTIFDNVLVTDDVYNAKKELSGLKDKQDGEKKVKEEQDKVERESASEDVKKDDDDDEDDDNDEHVPQET